MRLSRSRLFFIFVGTSIISLISLQTVFASNAYSPNESTLSALQIFGDSLGMSDADPRTIVARLINIAMGFIGIIVLVRVLWSGVSFMTSGGDEEKTKNATKSFFNTILGLAIMLSAYSVVSFVLRTLGTATTI